MHLTTDQIAPVGTEPSFAAKYRAAHQNRLMLLSKIRGDVPARDEFCRIVAVEELAPNLWLTVRFLDDSRKGLRAGTIRLATKEEEQLSQA